MLGEGTWRPTVPGTGDMRGERRLPRGLPVHAQGTGTQDGHSCSVERGHGNHEDSNNGIMVLFVSQFKPSQCFRKDHF